MVARRRLDDLLQGPERTPLRRQERLPLQSPEPARIGGLLRQREWRLLRCEGRTRLRAQAQHREQALLRCDKQGLARGPDMEMERGSLKRQARPRFSVRLQRLLRALWQGPSKRQGLPP